MRGQLVNLAAREAAAALRWVLIRIFFFFFFFPSV